MEYLLKEDIIKTIEGKGRAERIPLLYDIWIRSNAFGDSEEKLLKWLKPYPRDVDEIFLPMPENTKEKQENPEYNWNISGTEKVLEKHGIDKQQIIEDWEDEEQVEKFFCTFPNADFPKFPKKKRDGRYLIGRWWGLYFERLWSIRGIENALTDFYFYPDEIMKLFDYLTKFYIRLMERAKKEWDVDGFFVSDDIGTQNAPFFSLEIFRKFFRPYYKQLIDKAHKLGAHFWLHSCGNIQLFLPDFIEIGLDVIHPIQKNTMNSKEIAHLYGSQICILAGIDVQHCMAFGSTDEVEDEVRTIMETYDRSDGRFMITMGNGSTPDWKQKNMEALYKASWKYEEEKKHAGIINR